MQFNNIQLFISKINNLNLEFLLYKSNTKSYASLYSFKTKDFSINSIKKKEDYNHFLFVDNLHIISFDCEAINIETYPVIGKIVSNFQWNWGKDNSILYIPIQDNKFKNCYTLEKKNNKYSQIIEAEKIFYPFYSNNKNYVFTLSDKGNFNYKNDTILEIPFLTNDIIVNSNFISINNNNNNIAYIWNLNKSNNFITIFENTKIIANSKNLFFYIQFEKQNNFKLYKYDIESKKNEYMKNFQSNNENILHSIIADYNEKKKMLALLLQYECMDKNKIILIDINTNKDFEILEGAFTSVFFVD